MSKKEQIIEVAMKLFAKKGYHATSMQEIAEHSQLAKGSLYNKVICASLFLPYVQR